MGELTTADLAAQIEKALAYGSTIREACQHKAEEVLDYWQSIAPVAGDRPTKDASFPTEDGRGKIVDLGPGDYRSSLHIESSPRRVRVGSTEKIVIFAEFGTKHFPAGHYAMNVVLHFNGTVDEAYKPGRRPKSVGGIDLVEDPE